MISIKDLTFAYNAENQFKFPDFTCEQGSQWLLLGQSGCGKTTLLHLLAGFIRPKTGSIIIHDQEITTMTDSLLDKIRGKMVGVVFQQSHLINSLTVEENLLAAQFCAGLKTDKKRAREILERLNLQSKLNDIPSRLSQGQRQRVAIARALINKPSLILADEPTSSLDDKNSDEVLQLLEQQAQQEKATLLIVTHDNRLKSKLPNQITL